MSPTGESRHISLSKTDKFAVVDAADYEWLNQWTWSLWKAKGGKLYARRTVNRRGESPQYRSILMHRLIRSINDSKVHVDHWDGDGLNNRRLNLRPCNRSQNIANQKRRTGGRSKFKGVNPSKLRWQARISVNGVRRHLGSFRTEEDAALAYNAAAVVAFGEFANLNEVEEAQ